MNFNQCLVQVTCQYSENYGYHDWDGVGPCPQGWKFKGGSYFRFLVDVDDLMYGGDMVVDVVREVLRDMSNDCVRYEYVSHQVFFEEPLDITEEINQRLMTKVGS